jgi:hypothetical protein
MPAKCGSIGKLDAVAAIRLCQLRISFSRGDDYKGDSNFIALFTPLTFLVTYFNSGVNPLLYAFLSRNFRKGMRELLLCSFKKNKNKSIHQRLPLNVSTNFPVLVDVALFVLFVCPCPGVSCCI